MRLTRGKRRPFRPPKHGIDRYRGDRISGVLMELRQVVFYGEVKAHTNDLRCRTAGLLKENRTLRKRCNKLHKQVVDLLSINDRSDSVRPEPPTGPPNVPPPPPPNIRFREGEIPQKAK